MNLFRSALGSTRRLVEYAGLYFALYTLYGLLVKVFQGPAAKGLLGFSEVQFLVYSTLGSAVVCLGVIFAASWWRARFTARELAYILASGTCTAIVIPTTTLMYSLPISVMVAMVLMRGSIIVVSRLVDAALIAQGISKKKVRWEENLAVTIAVSAVGLNIVFAQAKDFDFLNSVPAMSILSVYLVAYTLRIYLMNYFKFTRSSAAALVAQNGGAQPANNKNYFALEQLTASFWIYGFAALAVASPGLLPGSTSVAEAFTSPHPLWVWAAVAGLPFGLSAFFSVFLFMFEGRTSTFSGLANRLSSLLAGTISTLLFAFFFGGNWPKTVDWMAFTLLLLAVACLTRAELRKR